MGSIYNIIRDIIWLIIIVFSPTFLFEKIFYKQFRKDMYDNHKYFMLH